MKGLNMKKEKEKQPKEKKEVFTKKDFLKAAKLLTFHQVLAEQLDT